MTTETIMYVVRLYDGTYAAGTRFGAGGKLLVEVCDGLETALRFSTASDAHREFPGAQVVKVTVRLEDVK